MSENHETPPPDRLTQRIGVLTRRETEARVLAPVIEAMAESFGREEVLEILRDVIVRLAREQGGELAEAMGGDGPDDFMRSMEFWRQDNALEIEVLEKTDTRLAFNVTGCRYAQMYKALGIPELGAILSCNRDFAFAEGFNRKAKLTRTQTILSGAGHCDFRFDFDADAD